MFAFVMFDLVF